MRPPKMVKCKICGQRFRNPLTLGSSIVIVTCDDCRRAMFSPATLRKMEQDSIIKTDEEVMLETFMKLRKPKNRLSSY